MIIKEIQMTHFGKFHNKTITFEDGVNILHGKNEAGKSTIHTFIRCMLFGMDPSVRPNKKMNVYKMYEPWEDQGGYGGTLTFTQWDKTYRIERSFLRSNSFVRLYDLTDQIELKPAKEQLSTLLGGMSETAYRNTVSISQMQSVTDEGLAMELRNHMANLGAAKSVEIDLASAEQYLINERKAYEKKIVKRADEQRRNILSDWKDTQYRLEQMLRQESEGQKELAHSRKREYDLFQDEKKKRQECEKSLQQNQERMKRLEHETERWALDRENWKEKTGLRENEISSGKTPEYSLAGRILSILLLVVSALVGAFYLYDLLNAAALKRIPKYMFSEVIAPVCILLLLFSLFWMKHMKKDQKRRVQAYKMYLQRTGEYQEAKETLEHLDLQTKQLTEKLREMEESDYMMLHEKNDQLDKDLLRIGWEIEQEQTRNDELSMEVDKINEICNQNMDYETEIEAIDLALKTMGEVAVNINDSFGKKLNEKASDYLAVITKGAYHKILIDDQFNILLSTNDRLVKLEQLSGGTMEQIYLCVRLAAADLMYGDCMLPLFLDDTFAYYDDGRTSDTILLLKTLNRQVIILTCHGREQEMLKDISE